MFLTKDSKSPFYQVTYFVNGKRTKKSTKTSNIKEARKFLDSFSPSTKEKLTQLSPAFTLSQFKDEYLKYAKLRFSKSYVERSIELSFKLLIEFAGNIPLKQLDPKTLDNFIMTKYSNSKAGASLNYRTLKAAFSKGVVWDYFDENPLKKIKAPKVPKSHPIFINQEELNLILSNTVNLTHRNIFSVAFYTGMRLSEILNMKLTWINAQQNIITIKNSKEYTSKSKKERIIPIHPLIKSILIKNGSAKDDFIFNVRAGIKFNENFISKQFKKTVRRAMLNDKIHFHTLRHSFASNLVQRGVNLYVVKELLGHEDIKTTQIYSHLNQSSLSDAVRLL